MDNTICLPPLSILPATLVHDGSYFPETGSGRGRRLCGRGRRSSRGFSHRLRRVLVSKLYFCELDVCAGVVGDGQVEVNPFCRSEAARVEGEVRPYLISPPSHIRGRCGLADEGDRRARLPPAVNLALVVATRGAIPYSFEARQNALGLRRRPGTQLTKLKNSGSIRYWQLWLKSRMVCQKPSSLNKVKRRYTT
jgi:hypothetical protein